MTKAGRWDRCILQRGTDVAAFVKEFLSQPHRRLLVIGGGGFDPRATRFCELLKKENSTPISAIFIREERPNTDAEVRTRAEANVKDLLELVPAAHVNEVQIFAADNAVIGGREAVKLLSSVTVSDFTDIAIDCSALSRGVAFPIIKFILDTPGSHNVHVFVVDEPFTDSEISPVAWEQASYVLGFRGTKSSSSAETFRARLWLPQLVLHQRVALDLIHRLVPQSAAACWLPWIWRIIGFIRGVLRPVQIPLL